MNQMDIAWIEENAAVVPAPPVSAAKLHVLQLEPIRERLGPRWPKLSALVHKLFEKSLRRSQGPGDYFMPVGELSYIATFHGLAPQEAGLACAAVAREVCELLFGEDSEQISIRSLIGTVPGPVLDLAPSAAKKIAETLEETGKEIIITSRERRPAPSDPISQAQAQAATFKHTIGFYPAWDLARKTSQMLCLGLKSGSRRGPAGALRTLGRSDGLAGMEILALRAAAAYGARLEQAGQVCAINVGVSCDTLCAFGSRIAYIQALKSVKISRASPLFLKIEQIPPGTPVGRLGELTAMLSMPGLRLLLEFEQIRAVPQLDIRLGVTGIGTVLPDRCEPDEARLLAGMLRARAQEQKACTFLHGIDTPEMAAAVTASHIKFGAGLGFGPAKFFSLSEGLPGLPLKL